MKGYDETMKYLEEYYEECSTYWREQKCKIPEMNAIADIHLNITGVNEFAKIHFLDKKIAEYNASKL